MAGGQRDSKRGNGPKTEAESEISSGSLYASGLIAAGGIMGLLGVCVKVYEAAWDKIIRRFSPNNPLHKDWISVICFAALAFSSVLLCEEAVGFREDSGTG